MRAVDLGAVVDVEDLDRAGVFLDSIDNPVCAAPCSVAASQRAEQRLTDAVRADSKGSLAELQHGSGDRLGKPLRDRPPRGWLEPDLDTAALARCSSCCQWRGAGPDPAGQWPDPRRGSPRPNAARLSEMRATASVVSPRISRVISRPSRSSDRDEHGLGLAVARQGDPLMLLADSPGQFWERRAFASDSGTGVAAIVIVRSIGYVGHFSSQHARRRLDFLQPAVTGSRAS